MTGSFLYYGRALDSTILPALNEIASAQAQPTEKTKQQAQQLMDYLATYPKAYIRYHASDMILNIDSDAAYLVAPKARCRVAGYYHLTSNPNTTTNPSLNGAIHVECKTLHHVVSSASEAKVEGVHNSQITIPIRSLLLHYSILNLPLLSKQITLQRLDSYTTTYIKSSQHLGT